MTDVVELAKERRARLAAEVGRLDNFLRLAMALTETGNEDIPGMDPVEFGLDAAAGHDDELILTDMQVEDTAELDIHVGKMIRYRRWMMGMTQEQLGELMGIKIDRIRSFESGVRHASASVLRDIALAMEVPVSFFLEELDEEAPEADGFYGDALPDS